MVDGQYSTQGWNRYSYVQNNPIIYKDPTGHLIDPFSFALGTSFAAGKALYDYFSNNPEKEKKAAAEQVNKMFDKAVKDNKHVSGSARFKGVVDNLTDQFKSVKYKSEDQLAYTYSALMKRMGKEFGPGDNRITYDFAIKDIGLYDDKTGSMRETSHVDCTNYQTIGINILGLNKPGAHNVSEYRPNDYDYDPGIKKQKDWGAVKNFRFNTSLFRKVSPNSDLTGTIGVTHDGSKYNHAFTSLNSNSTTISESTAGGIRNTDNAGTINYYKSDLKAEYLRLRLPAWKK